MTDTRKVTPERVEAWTPEKQRSCRKQYRETNPDKVRASRLKYRLANREKLRLAQAEYRARNRDSIVEKRRQYYYERPERAAESDRKWRKNNPDKCRSRSRRWVEANREKQRVHNFVCRQVRLGRIVRPAICSKCGLSGKIEGHHEDYAKRLEITWLCHKCHSELRRKFAALALRESMENDKKEPGIKPDPAHLVALKLHDPDGFPGVTDTDVKAYLRGVPSPGLTDEEAVKIIEQTFAWGEGSDPYRDEDDGWEVPRAALAHLKGRLTQQAPASGEREEMVHLMDKVERKLVLPQGKKIARKIRSLILAQPSAKKVTREWVEKWAGRILAGNESYGLNDMMNNVIAMLREQGIEVEDKP